jgi:hypothetical protein
VPYFVGYFAVLLGLLLVQGVAVAFILPATAVIVALWLLLGNFGMGLGAVIVGPLWIWFAFRFFFPAAINMIWIDGRFVLFALHRVTPERMVGVVTAQLAVLRSDLMTVSGRIRRWLNA